MYKDTEWGVYFFSAVYFFSEIKVIVLIWGLIFGKTLRESVPISDVFSWPPGFCNLYSYELGFKDSIPAL